jgi:hypothetical protein
MIKFRFKYDYCKTEAKRIAFNTTLNENLVKDFKQVKDQTGIDISKLIEVAFFNIFSSQESVDKFMQQVKDYKHYYEYNE